MAVEWLPALITGGLGFVGGVGGTIFAPWAKWRWEEKGLRRQHRVEQVLQWRAGIDQIGVHARPTYNENDEAQITRWLALDHAIDVDSQHWYATLSPHLSEETRMYCEMRGNASPEEYGPHMVRRLTAEVARIEQTYV